MRAAEPPEEKPRLAGHRHEIVALCFLSCLLIASSRGPPLSAGRLNADRGTGTVVRERAVLAERPPCALHSSRRLERQRTSFSPGLGGGHVSRRRHPGCWLCSAIAKTAQSLVQRGRPTTHLLCRRRISRLSGSLCLCACLALSGRWTRPNRSWPSLTLSYP